MKKRLICLILGTLIILSFSGCINTTKDKSNLSETGVEIIYMASGIGAVGNNTDITDVQRYSYEIVLFNGEKDEIYINRVEPILSTEFSKRLLTEDRKVIVEKTIASNTSIKINGELMFDSKGVSKKEIVSWEPFITGFKISYEGTLQV